MKTIAIIGCGGQGSHFAYLALSVLRALETPCELHLIDGDVFEEKNMTRQLGCKPGTPKVNAIAEHLQPLAPEIRIVPVHGYVGNEEADDHLLSIGSSATDLTIVMMVDNYGARRRILSAFYGGLWPKAQLLITGANEYWDAHATAHLPIHADTPYDYRRMYPETLTKQDVFDPARPSCTKAAEVPSSAQLAMTNVTGAVLAANLLAFYHKHLNTELFNYVKANPDKPILPLETWAIQGNFETTKIPLNPKTKEA